MIDAEIKGKLPEIHYLEDALTSCYFGLIKYCSITVLNNFFLKSLKNLENQQFYLDSIQADLIFKIFFWPRCEDNSEPDLLIVIFNYFLEVKYLFLVEVKYFSQQNTYETTGEFESHTYENQLSREYINLFSINKINNFILNENTSRFLIYLTADYSIPKNDFDKALNELKGHSITNDPHKTLLWVSWYDLYSELNTKISNLTLQNFEINILNDLKNYLQIKSFWSFNGFGPFDSDLTNINFIFHQRETKIVFDWNFQENMVCEKYYIGG